MYIVYTLSGIEKVDQLFGSKMKDVCIEDRDETFENKQLKFIYNFLNQVENIKKMDECALRYEIELNRWGHKPEVIPQEMLKSSTVSYINPVNSSQISFILMEIKIFFRF